MRTDAASGDVPVDRPADATDEVLDRITHRLRVDPELRLEVRQELRSHLDESIAQFRQAGRNEADARVEAIGALGDQNELAEQLWRSNRRRVRLRAAVLWGARLLLPLTAAALILLLGYNTVVSWAVLSHVWQGRSMMAPPASWRIMQRYSRDAMARGSDQAKQLIALDNLPREQRVDAARRLADETPTDPALYALYALNAVESDWFSNGSKNPAQNEKTLSDVLPVLVEGERREPDNAFYPLMQAGALFQNASREDEDPGQTIHRPGKSSPQWWSRLIVSNPDRYRQALAALHRAAQKPYYRSYSRELLQRKLDAIPIERVADALLRLRLEMTALLPHLNHARAAFWSAALEATDAARHGRREEARRALEDLRKISAATMSDASSMMEFCVAVSSRSLLSEAEARVHEALGERAAAEDAWNRHDQLRANYEATVAGSQDPDRYRLGVLYDSSGVAGRKTDEASVVPMRRAEYWAFDELGVAACSMCLLLLAATYAAATLIARFASRQAIALRVTIGPRRAARIVLLGAIVPVGIFLLYTRLNSLSGRRYGLDHNLPRELIQYIVLAVFILLAVSTLARRAVFARLGELGLAMPAWVNPSGGRKALANGAGVMAALCAAVAVALLFADDPVAGLSRRQTFAMPTVLLWIAWVLIAVAVLSRWRPPILLASHSSQPFSPSATVARSALEVVLLAGVVLAAAGLPLRLAESWNMHAAMRVAGSDKPRTFFSDAGSRLVETLSH